MHVKRSEYPDTNPPPELTCCSVKKVAKVALFFFGSILVLGVGALLMGLSSGHLPLLISGAVVDVGGFVLLLISLVVSVRKVPVSAIAKGYREAHQQQACTFYSLVPYPGGSKLKEHQKWVKQVLCSINPSDTEQHLELPFKAVAKKIEASEDPQASFKSFLFELDTKLSTDLSHSDYFVSIEQYKLSIGKEIAKLIVRSASISEEAYEEYASETSFDPYINLKETRKFLVGQGLNDTITVAENILNELNDFATGSVRQS